MGYVNNLERRNQQMDIEILLVYYSANHMTRVLESMASGLSSRQRTLYSIKNYWYLSYFSTKTYIMVTH